MTDPGFRFHVNRFSHLVINVSDLERSITFYEQATPLRVYSKTSARSQSFPSLGIERGDFDGAMLADSTSVEPGVSVHLVQWLSPRAVGSAYPTFFHAGFVRFCFEVADPMGRYEELKKLGIEPFGSPRSRGQVSEGGRQVLSFSFPDPDGVSVHMTRRPPNTLPGVPDQLYHVSPVVRDLGGARSFFERFFGLECVILASIPNPAPAGYGLGSELGQFDAAILGHPGDNRFHIDLCNWVYPGVEGEPYSEPNHVGIQRLAFEVDDLDAARAALLNELPADLCSTVSDPDTWDLGEYGVRRVVLFTSPDGLRLELVEAPPHDLANP